MPDPVENEPTPIVGAPVDDPEDDRRPKAKRRAVLATACPVCNSGDSKKVSAVYAEGTSTVTSESTGGGVAFGANGKMTPILASSSTKGVQQTQFAKLCSPPEKKNSAMGCIGLLLGAIGGLAIGGVVASAADSTGVGVAVGIMAGLGCLVPFAKAHVRADIWNKEVWTRLHKSWESRWICCRCHAQFVPGEGVMNADELGMQARVIEAQLRQREARVRDRQAAQSLPEAWTPKKGSALDVLKLVGVAVGIIALVIAGTIFFILNQSKRAKEAEAKAAEQAEYARWTSASAQIAAVLPMKNKNLNQYGSGNCSAVLPLGHPLKMLVIGYMNPVVLYGDNASPEALARDECVMTTARALKAISSTADSEEQIAAWIAGSIVKHRASAMGGVGAKIYFTTNYDHKFVEITIADFGFHADRPFDGKAQTYSLEYDY